MTLQQMLLTGSYTSALRALVMAGNLVDVLFEVPGDALDGSVDIDRTREVPRLGRIVIDGRLDAYRPRTVASWTWPYRLWRLERGAIVAGTPQYTPLMTGLLNEPSESVRSRKVPATLTSRLALANQQFSGPLVLRAGTRLQDVVYTIGAMAGLGTDPALYQLADASRALGADRACDVQDNMLQTMHQLATDNGLVLSDDALGRTTLAPWVEPTTAPAVWAFNATADAVTLDVVRTVRAQERIYNRSIVVGVAPYRLPIEAQARDLNPASPTYNPETGSGPVGDRPAPRHVSADIHDQATANLVALQRLYEGALFEETVNVPAVPLPGVEANQVVRIVGAGADATFLLDRVSLPLRGGRMELSTRRLRSLIAP